MLHIKAGNIMPIEFNSLEAAASKYADSGQFKDALRVYLFMADGDPSLDGGYLGGRIGKCYEALGELDAARYWYARAVEENPHVRTDEAEARKRLGDISVSDVLNDEI